MFVVMQQPGEELRGGICDAAKKAGPCLYPQDGQG